MEAARGVAKHADAGILTARRSVINVLGAARRTPWPRSASSSPNAPSAGDRIAVVSVNHDGLEQLGRVGECLRAEVPMLDPDRLAEACLACGRVLL